MVKTRSILLIMIVILFLSGCSANKNSIDKETNGNNTILSGKILVENTEGIKGVAISSLPESGDYYFENEAAKKIIDYLVNLNLNSELKGNPEESVGQTWVISIEYENGEVKTIYHLGNEFIRNENSDWYMMEYEEAKKLDLLILRNK